MNTVPNNMNTIPFILNKTTIQERITKFRFPVAEYIDVITLLNNHNTVILCPN